MYCARIVVPHLFSLFRFSYKLPWARTLGTATHLLCLLVPVVVLLRFELHMLDICTSSYAPGYR
jgi:hypothetical protein